MIELTIKPHSNNVHMFPEVETTADITYFVVSTTVGDRFLLENDLTLKEVEELIEKVLKVDTWEQERDSALRGTFLIGCTSMKQEMKHFA